MPDFGPEFPTRQALANAADGVGLLSLAQDGYDVDSLPQGDTELRAAWQELEGAVRDLETAVEKVRTLLPESAKIRRWRESKETSRA